MYGQDQRLGHGNRTGVCCYSSTDLYHWKYEGTALATGSTPEKTRNTGVLERPKVIYNSKTGKYVMWMHLDADGYTMSEAGVAVSGSPTGPFEFIRSFRPVKFDYGYHSMDGGNEALSPEDSERLQKIGEKDRGNTFRDMNLFADDDGSGYVIYSSENNSSIYIVKLSDDYTDVARPLTEGITWARAIINQKREAPAPFKYKGRYYMITSGLTGWAANAASYHTADHILGPWTSHENPCRGPEAGITFGSQSTFVLPAPGKPEGSFIFMADIWDADKLENSRLFWQPFFIRKDGSFIIENLDRWNMNIFDPVEEPLPRPDLTCSDGTTDSLKTLSWKMVKGAGMYHILINGEWQFTTTTLSCTLPLQLAGTIDTCRLESATLEGMKSEYSQPVIVSWDQPANILLSKIHPASWIQGFGNPHLNRALQGTPLQIKDRNFETGFGVHAVSELHFFPGGHYKRFTSWVGVDAYTRFNTFGSVEFIVKGDEKELFRSGLMTAEDEARFVDISLEGVNELTLIVTDGGNGNHYDHADWCEPYLYAE